MFTINKLSGKEISFSNNSPLVFILGPCAIESRNHAFEVAHALCEIFSNVNANFIFKSSFDKANRTSLSGFRGVGMDMGLSILSEIREKFDIPVVTDIHNASQALPVSEAVDMLQIPAFLCRQTDLILAACSTGKPVNIKKGQFLAPWDMSSVLSKAKSVGAQKILLCERGTTFGYGNLVVDMRGLQIMKELNGGTPIVFDATHSVQLPGAGGTCSGGQRQYVPPLARAATAVGISTIFMEVHPDPDKAPCDGANMLSLLALPPLLHQLMPIDGAVKLSTTSI